jgi:hypothetical protein
VTSVNTTDQIKKKKKKENSTKLKKLYKSHIFSNRNDKEAEKLLTFYWTMTPISLVHDSDVSKKHTISTLGTYF